MITLGWLTHVGAGPLVVGMLLVLDLGWRLGVLLALPAARARTRVGLRSA